MVSVIIPVYNSEKTIKECVESALLQSYKDIEIIAVNDGSKDTSLDILREYVKADCRIMIIDKENSGVSAARNSGLLCASGEYVVFLDADDRLDDHCVERLMECMTEDVDLVVGSYSEFRTKTECNFIKREKSSLSISDIKNDMLRYDPLFETPWAKLFRMSIINRNCLKFDESLVLGEDHRFNLQYLKSCRKIAVSDKNVYYYRLGGMASSNKFYDNKIDLNLSLLDSYAEFFGEEDNVPSDFLFKKTKDQFFGCIKHFYLFCNKAVAVQSVVKALDRFSHYLENDKQKKFYTDKEKKYIASKYAEGIIRCVVMKDPLKLAVKKCVIKLKKSSR